MRPRVKMCCIQSAEEVDIAVRAGADAIGLVGRGLSGPEVIEDDEVIRAIAATVPAGVASFLLTREQDPDRLAAQVVRCSTSVVQLCDAVDPAAWRAVRRQAPWVRILQVVHVSGEEAVEQALAAAPHVDGLLLDSGAPSGPSPVYGGTGQTHDWSVSARIVAQSSVPVWLAGGLRADNVAEAWRIVRPFGLDLCSGLRTAGALDPLKAERFMAAVARLSV
jgi:phosphoribosylanthranilate isomerase